MDKVRKITMNLRVLPTPNAANLCFRAFGFKLEMPHEAVCTQPPTHKLLPVMTLIPTVRHCSRASELVAPSSCPVGRPDEASGTL